MIQDLLLFPFLLTDTSGITFIVAENHGGIAKKWHFKKPTRQISGL